MTRPPARPELRRRPCPSAHPAGTPARPHARRSSALARGARFVPGLLVCLAVPAAPAQSAGGWYPRAGVSWVRPLDSTVNRLYGSGPAVHAGLGFRISSRLSAEVGLAWRRGTGHPAGGLAPSARGTLTTLPFWTELRLRPWKRGVGGGAIDPWVAAGPAVVFSREELRYRLFESETTLRGRRSDLGGTAASGLDLRARGWQVSICARAVVTGGRREVLRAGGRSDERPTAAKPSLGGAGVEVRIPLP